MGSDSSSGVRQVPHADAPDTQRIIAGRYRLESYLGEGGMGTVYRAQHLLLGQSVAVKMLRPELAMYDDLVERFSREARASAQLSGPHLVQVFDVGNADGTPFMVMELLEGRDLGELLDADDRLPLETAVRFATQAAKALAVAHAAGIVHRDIKPENLFLTTGDPTRGTIKVLDFGVSKRCGDKNLTQRGQNIGSPQYMAPEQVRDPGSVDGRADIWSLGLVLFELVTGRPAFDGDTLAEIWAGIFTSEPPPMRSLRPDTPSSLQRVFEKCVRKDPADRYQSMSELVAALELVLEVEAAEASTLLSAFDGQASGG